MINLIGSPGGLPPMNTNLRLLLPEDNKNILIVDGDKIVKEVHNEMLRQALEFPEPDLEKRKFIHNLFAQVLLMADADSVPGIAPRLVSFGPPPPRS